MQQLEMDIRTCSKDRLPIIT